MNCHKEGGESTPSRPPFPHLSLPYQQGCPGQQVVNFLLSAEVARQQWPQDIKVLSNLQDKRKVDKPLDTEIIECLTLSFTGVRKHNTKDYYKNVMQMN